jgi:hypothetical protein
MRITLDNVYLLAGHKPIDWMMELSVPIEGDYEEKSEAPETFTEFLDSFAKAGSDFYTALKASFPIVPGFKKTFEDVADAEMRASLLRAEFVSPHARIEWSSEAGSPLDDMIKYAESLRGGKMAPWGPIDATTPRESHVHISAKGWEGASPSRGVIDEPYWYEYAKRTEVREQKERDESEIADQIAEENGTSILRSAKKDIALPPIKKNSGPPKKRMR